MKVQALYFLQRYENEIREVAEKVLTKLAYQATLALKQKYMNKGDD